MRPRDTWLTIAWGLYCAASWTWCIGMFLPVLLIDRFGWPGVIAFALPNIAGVVVFGYVVRERTRSEKLIERHGNAMRWFSVVTIAFHMFFLMALGEFAASAMPESPYTTMAIVAGPFVLGLLIASLSMRLVLVAACVAWVASMAVFAETGGSALTSVPWNGPMSTLQLAPLVLIFFIGFFACPFFDLTFHRAVRESPSRHAFAVFAPAFALMLLLTVVIWQRGDMSWPSLAFGHLLWQSAITIGLHLRELRGTRIGTDRATMAAALIAPLAGLALGMWAVHEQISEPVYIRFLVFYGLVFPAYAILFMHPQRPLALSRKNMGIFVLVIAAALPCYELGFIHDHTWLLLIPVAGAVVWLTVASRQARPSQ